jgi:hypothetical protein
MVRAGLLAERDWVSASAPDDAEAFLGGLVGNPVFLGVALIFIGAALLLSRPGAAPSLSDVLASGSAPPHLALFPILSSDTVLRVKNPDSGLARRSRGQGQTGKQVFDQGRIPRLLNGKSGPPFDLRLLRMKANASLERGPPLSRKVNDLAAPDGISSHARSRTYRDVRQRTTKVVVVKANSERRSAKKGHKTVVAAP